ncbi:uncharacterized protein YwbO-like isoform X2 [Dysidea avara]|uniref:uncharacterized protein YwbO-like isoform X2 n=1 Tax=Dysidea avara TaxID=196820 RepID=UPI00331C0154
MEGIEKLDICIDITSDIICPWCWVGKRKLDTACEQVKDIFNFKIRWKPYLLSPNTPEEGVPYVDHIRYKYGEAAAKAAFEGTSPLYEAASSVGIKFDRTRKVVITKKAHLLLEYAFEQGKQHELQEVIFRTYFQDGQNIYSDSVLEKCVAEVGMDPTVVKTVLRDSRASDHYDKAIEEAFQRDVNGVPYFEIYLASNPLIRQQFSGAQSPETFIHVFNRVRLVAKV